MLGLYNIGKGARAKKEEKEDNSSNVAKKSSAALRIQGEWEDLDLPDAVRAQIPDPDNLMHFRMIIIPDTGLWRSAKYTFEFNVPHEYPHKPPVVKCKEKIYHPNIDLQGNVCLNLLREDWRPVLEIQHIVHGLIFLFLEPNANDPLNQEAAKVYRQNEQKFNQNVAQSLLGRSVSGEAFPMNKNQKHDD